MPVRLNLQTAAALIAALLLVLAVINAALSDAVLLPLGRMTYQGDALVRMRIGELRERRLPGIPPIEEFMARRFTPAVATCATVSQRLHDLSERVAQASALLSTRVDIMRERQNQALLGSMDRRAKLQLRLQQTVEGLSVAAIVYYVAGVTGYLAKAAKAFGLHVEPDLIVGVAIPLVAVLVIREVRHARRRINRDDAAGLID